MKRRDFLSTTAGVEAGASQLSSTFGADVGSQKKKRVVMAGTRVRGIDFWGNRIGGHYYDFVKFVSLYDQNPGRLELVITYIGVNTPIFTDFEK